MLTYPEGNNLKSTIALDEDRFVAYSGDLFLFEPQRLLCFDRERKDTFQILNESYFKSIPNTEISSISVMKTEVGIEHFGPVALQGVISLTGKRDDEAITIFPNYQPFWQTGNRRYFKEEFNDTIYRIEPDQIVPERIFNLGSLRWLPEDRLDKRKGNGIYISQILEGEEHLLFRFIKEIYNDDPKNYIGIYTKSSGKVSIGPAQKGFSDDLNNFLPIYPVTVSPWGEYVAFLAADDIREWIDETPDIPSSLIHLKDIKEDDNPVIVLIK